MQHKHPLQIDLLHKLPQAPLPFLAPPQQQAPPIPQPQVTPTSQPMMPNSSQPTVMPPGGLSENNIPGVSLSHSNLPMTVAMPTSTLNQGQTTPTPSFPVSLSGPSSGSWHSHNTGSIVNAVQTSNSTVDDDDFADFQEAPKISKGLSL